MAITASKSPWLYGLYAAALVSVDDFCPADQGVGYDFGGNLTDAGVARSFFLDTLLARHPGIRLNWFTIANYRLDVTNLSNPPFADGTYRLTNQPAWVAQAQAWRAQYPQLTYSYHGYIHLRPGSPNGADEFATTNYSAAQATAALDAMAAECAAVGFRMDPAFRPPGWGYQEALYDWLAARQIVYCDNPDLPTAIDQRRPTYYTTASGKRLLRIAVPWYDTYRTVIETYRGAWVDHYHWSDNNANGINKAAQQAQLLADVADMRARYGPELGWLSYGEMGTHFARQDAVTFATGVSGATLTITTGQPLGALTGVTFEVAGGPTTVNVVDSAGATVPTLRFTTPVTRRDCVVCGVTRLPVHGGGRRVRA